MASQSPQVDKRTATDIDAQVRALMKLYLPGFSGQSKGTSAALIGIFSRYAEIFIQRLNQAPDKNFLAFLDLLGASLLPPQPARVPLTFSLATGSASDGRVPIGTQVAAPPGPGETEPVIYETEHELVVTAAQLASLYARDPNLDQYGSIGALMALGQQPNPFWVTTPIEHVLYIGDDDLLSYPSIDTLTLHVALAQAAPNPLSVSWERRDSIGWVDMAPSSDTTAGFTKDGDIVFQKAPQVAPVMVNGITSRWLRCRLTVPITPAMTQTLPTIRTLTLEASLISKGLAPDAAFTNTLPIDVSKDFFPLGEKPRFGDTFHVAQRQGFAEPNATVTLHVTLTNPADGSAGSTPPPTFNAGNPKLSWEFWDGAAWSLIGTSELPASKNADGTVTVGSPKSTPATSNSFDDGTAALTKTGDVKFTFPNPPHTTTVNGVGNVWLRVRLVRGDYGKDAIYQLRTGKPEDGYILAPATLSPPIVQSLKIEYAATKPRTTADHVVTYNDFRFKDVSGASSFQPFRPTSDTWPSLYLGFTLPPSRPTFPNVPLSLYAHVADVVYGTQPDTAAPSAPPRLTWQYFNGQTWLPLTVQDNSRNLTQSGLIQFLVPGDSAMSAEFGEPRYWLRVRWEAGQYLFKPRLAGLSLNTTLAAQTRTIRDEILGTSDGSRGQKFQTTRAPVLHGQRLVVREGELPAVAERATIEAEEGQDALTVVTDSTGRPIDVWVRWHEVTDFYASGPRDRHYVFDHVMGTLQFGDGQNGLIPPLGAAVRMASYQTGGGVGGNRPAGVIVQLKTTIPYVDKVVNREPASGGANAEPQASLIERAPRTIRHRDRAVTVEDYADLAMLASPAVARTRAVPLYDLLANPLVLPDDKNKQSGVVSVMIVPRSDDAKPVPTFDLIQQVQDYVTARSIPTARVVVVGPLYVRINVTAEVGVASLDGASRVRGDIVNALTRFLHPLSGGLDGTGWDFGRTPYQSDLYALIGAIPDVDHVRKLIVEAAPEPAGADRTDRFLVYSGTHTITLTAERF